MRLVIEHENPSIVRLYDFTDSHGQIKESLTYTDKSANYQYQKFRKSLFWKQKLGEERYYAQLETLKSQVKKCLLKQDDKSFYTYSGLAGYLSAKTRVAVENTVRYPEPKKLPWSNPMAYEPYPYQDESFAKLLEVKHGGVEIGCHRKGEKVILYNGTLKEVQDIVVGDTLMGPDSLPRNVLELKRGTDSMYKIETVNGQTMFVNGHHILALKQTCRNSSYKKEVKRRKDFKGNNRITYLTVEEYLKKSNKFKHLNKMFSPQRVEFENIPVPLDPYFLGILLGDGSLLSSPNVTTMDSEIVHEIETQTSKLGLVIRKTQKPNSKATTYYLVDENASKNVPNKLTKILRELEVWGASGANKSVPQTYLANSAKCRMEVLAGLIDTDGSLSQGCFDYVSASYTLAQNVAFLARSLGLRATETTCLKSDQNGVEGTYFRVCISGNINCIPTRILRKQAGPRKQARSPNMFGFTVTKVADSEDYYGFVLDSDHLYLTDTFLVTHNTGMGKSTIIHLLTRALGLKTIIMSPATNITKQLHKQAVKLFGKKYVGLFCGTKKESNKLIVVATAQSLTRVTPDTPHWEALSAADVFMSDESHSCPATTMEAVCMGVAAKAPYRFFFSATQIRGDGKDLVLEGITGPIVLHKSVREGVEQGYLAKPSFRMKSVISDAPFSSQDPNEMTRKHLYYNDNVIKEVAKIANAAASQGWPTLILIEEIEQFARLYPYLRYQAGFAHGPLTEEHRDVLPKQFHDSDPTELVDAFNELKTPILVGTSCITTGTDILPVKMLVYWQGGRSETQVKQAIGRGTRKFPGKTGFTVVDFDVTNFDTVHRHAEARREIYRELYPDLKEL